jgi:ABC-type sugar transport system permease subunit
MSKAAEVEGPLVGQHAIAARRGRSRLSTSRHRAGFLFSLPVIVLTAALLFLPIVQTFYYSFTSWDGLTSTPVGLDNYVRLLNDAHFWRVLLNNFFLLASIPVAILIPLFVASLLNEHVVGWRFFRSAYFLNTAISWVVVGVSLPRTGSSTTSWLPSASGASGRTC